MSIDKYENIQKWRIENADISFLGNKVIRIYHNNEIRGSILIRDKEQESTLYEFFRRIRMDNSDSGDNETD